MFYLGKKHENRLTQLDMWSASVGGRFGWDLLTGTKVYTRTQKPYLPFDPVISLMGSYPKEVVQKTKPHLIGVFNGKIV